MNGRTPISALQELMAAKKLALPVYVEEPSGLSFKCTVHAAGITAVGISSNKKSAKHESAKNALEMLGATTKTPTFLMFNQPPAIAQNPYKNYVGELNEFASKRGLGYPEYEHLTVATAREFYVKCMFLGKETFGTGLTKKDGKQNAAEKMLEQVAAIDPVVIATNGLKTKETKFETPDKDKIITMFKTLPTNDTKSFAKSDELKSVPNIEIVPENSVKELEFKLQNYGIEYNLEIVQWRPIIIIFARIKGTDLHFAGFGASREEATRKVLLETLEAAQSGISLSTNDLISLN